MLSRYFVLFIIYSFIGWIYETCYCTIHEKAWENRGFLYGPCIPLYGVGATLAQIIFVVFLAASIMSQTFRPEIAVTSIFMAMNRRHIYISQRATFTKHIIHI